MPLSQDQMLLEFMQAAGVDPDCVFNERITRMNGRGTDTGPLMAWEIELDIFNGHVKYTRIGMAYLGHDLKLKFRNIAHWTRLWQPVKEVPFGAVVYLPDGDGPWTMRDAGFENVYTICTNERGEFLMPDDHVAVPFYYARGEGVIAGEVLMCSEQALIEAGYGVEGLDNLVNGCKFTLWSVALRLTTGKESMYK